MALNSYENRVYQIGIEDNPPVIAKFYRPQRWSDEAIIEEHQFAAELADHEIPVVAPLRTDNGDTLHYYQEFRFSLFPRNGGRPLELDNLEINVTMLTDIWKKWSAFVFTFLVSFIKKSANTNLKNGK